MKLLVKRKPSEAGATLGELFINGTKFCHTLEDEDRFLEADANNDGKADLDKKIYAKTAIPRGIYEVIITHSNRFKRELPLLVGVPGFEGIRIHPGNTSANTEGCILVGGAPTSKNFIPNSRATFNVLMEKLERAYERGERIAIEVT